MKKRILLVEDDQSILDIIAQILEINDFEVFQAENGKLALEILDKAKPDLFICDIQMPVMNGLELLNQIRSIEEYAQVPFIFLSARTSKEDIREGMNLSADDYLTKPFKASELLYAIRARLNRFNSLIESVKDETCAIKKQLLEVSMHEVNTPLHGIISASHFLINHPQELSESEKKDMLSVINLSAYRLHRTIRNLILYSTQNFHNYFIKNDNINSELVIQDVEQQVKNLTPNEMNRISWQLEYFQIKGSRELLALMIYELIENALKFSTEQVYILGSRTASNHYDIIIQDSGFGMSTEELRQLKAYNQINRKEQEQQGFGLGLELVKSISKELNYEFNLDSELGAGTKAYLRIQL